MIWVSANQGRNQVELRLQLARRLNVKQQIFGIILAENFSRLDNETPWIGCFEKITFSQKKASCYRKLSHWVAMQR